MSSEQITDVQAGEQNENGQGEAPTAAVQLEQQQQVSKEQLQLEGMVTEDQESMDTSSTHQEGGPATPMEDSMCSGDLAEGGDGTVAANVSGDADGDPSATCTEEGDENIPYDKKKIFVGGLSWETKDETLKTYFEKYGTVTEVKIKQDQVTQRSRGFAFVLFSSPDAVEEVMKNLPHTIDGRQVDAKRAIPHAIHQALKNRTNKIFVGGVPVDMPEETIRKYFVQYGEIKEIALVTDKVTKKRRGFIFVTYESEDSVDKCTEQTFHNVEDTQVEVKRATPREQSPGGGGGGGRGRGGRGQGGYGGRTQWAPYGQHFGGYGGYGGGYSPYGGYGYPPPPFAPYGGGGPYGAPGYDQGVYGSRYGPMKQNHSGGSYHPYSR